MKHSLMVSQLSERRPEETEKPPGLSLRDLLNTLQAWPCPLQGSSLSFVGFLRLGRVWGERGGAEGKAELHPNSKISVYLLNLKSSQAL